MFITETWQRITFGTKFVLISTILCCIFDMMTNDLLFNIFVDIPKNTLYEIQIWRLIIPQFFHENIINTIISLLGFLICAIDFEKTYGTITFFWDIFFKNLIIQFIFVFLSFCLSFQYQNILKVQSFGLWNISFIYMMNKALTDQDEPLKFLCFPFSLPSKYYPPIFFLLMNSIEYPRLDLMAATIFAFFEYQLFDGYLIKLSKGFVTKVECSIPFKYFKSRLDFITCDQANNSFVFEDAKQTQYQLEIGTISTAEIKTQDYQQL